MSKNTNLKPFNMSQRPSKQYPFLMPIVWLGSYLMTRPLKLKIEKVNMEGLKPPYLVIAAHQGFTDYYIGPLAMFPHRAMYVSDMEGFAAFGKWLYRGLGCIGKRRYVPEINVIKHIKYALSKKQTVFIYPESRHSNVGTTSYIPGNMGRLVKMMNVPLVILTEHGSYLANPFWDEEHTRKVPVNATMTCVYKKEDLINTSADDIQNTIETMLQYNEYSYQRKNNIKITYKNRAEGLHKPLYQCLSCGTKYEMTSSVDILKCNACNNSWEMTEYGQLLQPNNVVNIPDWYEWQRENVIKEISKNPNPLIKHFNISIEALPNEKGFINLGNGKLELNKKEFILYIDNTNEVLRFPHFNRESVQTEYNYKGKGMCIVLSTNDNCYYLYSNDKDFNPTELQFIGEHLYSNQR